MEFRITVQTLAAAMLYGLCSIDDLAFAQTWTLTTAPTTNWTSVAMSADGSTFVAGVQNGTIYTSTNSGVLWVPSVLPVAYWTSVTASADGRVLLAVNNLAGTNGGLYVSTNWGETWTNSFPFSGDWWAAASSADGTRLIVVGLSRPSLASTNSGATWAVIPVSGDYIASSADGMKLVTTQDEFIHTSSDGGATWTNLPSPDGDANLGEVACSANGTELVLAATSLSAVSVSTNSGATWAFTTVYGLRCVVASSAGGSRLVAASIEGPLHSSTDSGLTWSANSVTTSNNNWIAVACSADGTRLVAAAYMGGSIYTAIWPPALSTQLAGTNFVVSWPWPSSGFVLQQNCDLTTANWVNFCGSQAVSNCQNQVTVSPSNSAMFYRLAGPSF
jgi:hypothetical protein